MTEASTEKAAFRIFREAEAPSLMDGNPMWFRPLTDAQGAGLRAMRETGSEYGKEAWRAARMPCGN